MNKEYENINQSGQSKQYQPEDLSLKGYYSIGALSVIIGIVIVAILNLATPLQIITDRMAHLSRFSGPFFLLQFVPALLFLLLVYVSFRIVLSIILRPIARYLKIITTGGSLPEDAEANALLDVIIDSLDHFRDGFKLQDDVTLIVVKIGKA
jgi:hypothetical protein